MITGQSRVSVIIFVYWKQHRPRLVRFPVKKKKKKKRHGTRNESNMYQLEKQKQKITFCAGQESTYGNNLLPHLKTIAFQYNLWTQDTYMKKEVPVSF